MSTQPKYVFHDDREHADDLVNRYAVLVKRIAHHLAARLPDTIQIDDLIQTGMIGLLEAARQFDNSQGASFETYAGIRIRGAMLDEVRRHDWTPRSIHRRARELSEAIAIIENREGREATDQEVAEHLGVDVDEYYRILKDVKGHKLLSLDGMTQGQDSMLDHLADGSTAIEERLFKEDMKSLIAQALGGLPEREKLVLALYYDEELNLREIGAVIGVTESRVCQIHSQALLRLRARLNDLENGCS